MISPLVALLMAADFVPTPLIHSVTQLKSVCLAKENDPDKDKAGKLGYCVGYTLGVIDSWLAVRSKAYGLPPCFDTRIGPADKLRLVFLINRNLAAAAPKRTAAAYVLDTFIDEYPQCAAGVTISDKP